MSKTLLNLLVYIIKQMITRDLFDHILEIVKAKTDTDLTGAEKRAAVQAEIKEIRGDLAGAVQATSSTVINLAIEAAVLAVKGK